MTKLIPLAFAAFAITAGAASAENTFQLNRANSTSNTVVLDNVQADQAGTIELYEYGADDRGRFIGLARIEAGTTPELTVNVTDAPDERIVILMSNGNSSVTKLEVDDLLIN